MRVANQRQCGRSSPPTEEGRSQSRLGNARAEDVNDKDTRLWHPWLRINRVLCLMLQTRWSAEAWLVVRVEFKRALALKSEIRRAGWFNSCRSIKTPGLRNRSRVSGAVGQGSGASAVEA
jgi:hypothetical protein